MYNCVCIFIYPMYNPLHSQKSTYNFLAPSKPNLVTTITTKTIRFKAVIQKIKFTEHLLGQSRSIKHSAYSQED